MKALSKSGSPDRVRGHATCTSLCSYPVGEGDAPCSATSAAAGDWRPGARKRFGVDDAVHTNENHRSMSPAFEVSFSRRDDAPEGQRIPVHHQDSSAVWACAEEATEACYTDRSPMVAD